MSALFRRKANERKFIAAAAIVACSVLQVRDGLAGVTTGLRALAADDPGNAEIVGIYEVPKIPNKVLLEGGKLFWDRVNGYATFQQVSGSFYLGTVAADAAAADTTVYVNLNEQPHYRIAWGCGIWDTVAVKTAGTVIPNPSAGLSGRDPGGDNTRFTFSATAEAQKVDALSRESVRIADGPILEGRIAVYDIGDNAALDINIGLANATHATDADSITESVFFHLDGTALDIKAESDDGTTEVAATDTTVDAVDDTSFEVWIDARDPEDVQLYVDGVNVLPGTTFKLDHATGPLKALFHMEKTADDTLADVRVEFLRVRTTDLP